MSCHGMAGFVLAAGRGSRLRPLTDAAPKPLLPVGGRSLLDRSLERLPLGDADIAVNAHYLADAVQAHLGARRPAVHVQLESPEPLGTAGAIGAARAWLAGRDVLIQNADTYAEQHLDVLLDGWDGRRPRLLVEPTSEPADFGRRRFVGSSLLPAAIAARLPAEPLGLYEAVWRQAWNDGELDFVTVPPGTAIDCGTPPDYLRANLRSSRGRSVVASTAQVSGRLDRCVVLPDAVVTAGEVLSCCIRGRDGVTIAVNRALVEEFEEECAP